MCKGLNSKWKVTLALKTPLLRGMDGRENGHQQLTSSEHQDDATAQINK